jgi:hypothetical protein
MATLRGKESSLEETLFYSLESRAKAGFLEKNDPIRSKAAIIK